MGPRAADKGQLKGGLAEQVGSLVWFKFRSEADALVERVVRGESAFRLVGNQPTVMGLPRETGTGRGSVTDEDGKGWNERPIFSIVFVVSAFATMFRVN